ncbi:MAG: hypothetical protein HY684_06010 [Chloroflexi bacterium]|nr:hypothetical protein [Chloroflexota bacterium]
MGIDPRAIFSADWSQLATVTFFLFAFVFFVVLFAFSLLLAHAVLPSLILTGHVAPRANGIRPVLYILAVVFFLAALSTALTAFSPIGVLGQIYAEWLL